MGTQRARSGRTAHAFDTIDGTDKHSGPNRNARDPLRARVLKALSSRAARDCGHEDMRKPPQLHRFASRFCKQASGSITRQTPFAGWHAEQCRRQSPLATLMLQHCSTHRLQPAPALRHFAHETVTAAPRARKLPAAAQLLWRGKSACRSGLAQEVRDSCNSLAVEEGQLEAPGTRRGP